MEHETRWNDVERRDLQLGAFVLAACQASDRSAEARKPSMRSMRSRRSRRSTGPCQAPKSRKSKSNTERTTTAKLRLSVVSWNKLNKDQTRIKQ